MCRKYGGTVGTCPTLYYNLHFHFSKFTAHMVDYSKLKDVIYG